MQQSDEGQGTPSNDGTLDTAAQGFADYLSALDEPDTKKPSETQPTQESPESEFVEAEEGTEASDAENTAAQPETTDEEQTETSDETPVDLTRKVKKVIDGEEVEITLEEALNGYSRTADYTRKTQAHAQNVKSFEGEKQAVAGERVKYADMIGQMEQALKDMTGTEPDWAKVQAEQPAEFATLYTQWQIRQGELNALSTERQRAQQAVANDQQESRQRYIESEQVKLTEAIPEWKNPEKAKTEKAALVAYAEKIGFTREELSTVLDHRAILLLRKSMLFDKAQAAKPAITQRIEKVKAATPSATKQTPKPVSELAKTRQRLAKSGSLADAADAFTAVLGE